MATKERTEAERAELRKLCIEMSERLVSVTPLLPEGRRAGFDEWVEALKTGDVDVALVAARKLRAA